MIDRYGLLPPVLRMNAEREEMIVERHMQSAKALANELHALEPGRYEVTYFGEKAKPINGIIPNRWHIVRHNDLPAPDSYIPLTTETGGYREPASGDINRLMERDLWRVKDPVPQKKEPTEDRDQYVDELAADIRATNRLPGDGGLRARKWAKK